MNGSMIQLLVLAGIAVFLILKLRSVLGTREGFEKPLVPQEQLRPVQRQNLEVIEGGPDHDIVDYVPAGSDMARALAGMKRVDRNFSVGGFLQGARGAYEMILMAFERGDLADVRPFISDDVYNAFSQVIADREARGQTVEASFVGISEIAIHDVEFTDTDGMAEITLRINSEYNYTVRDRAGDIIEGGPSQIKRQRDFWVFGRNMDSNDPNWKLIATDA